MERKVGEASFIEFVKNVRARQLANPSHSPSILPSDHLASIMCRRVCDRILSNLPPVAEFKDAKALPWTIIVVDDINCPNAFALPGNHIVVFTGLFRFAQDEDEVASIMCHEIAHVLARHPAEKLSMFLFVGFFGALLEAAFGYNPFLRVLEKLAFELPFSREMENEADTLGMHLLGSSCFDCGKATNTFERMGRSAVGKQSPPTWLSTHPDFPERIARVKKLSSEMEAREGSNKARGDKCDKIKKAWQYVTAEEERAAKLQSIINARRLLQEEEEM